MLLVNSNPSVRKTALRRSPRSAAWAVGKEVPLRARPASAQTWASPHPEGWTPTNHWPSGHCGQSCPCCRSAAGDTLGACSFCTARGAPVPSRLRVGTGVSVVGSGEDEDGHPMKEVVCEREGGLLLRGWIYLRNLERDFVPGRGVPDGTRIEVVERGADEAGVGMYLVRTDTGARGWVYAKNVRDPTAECAICTEPLSDQHTCACSHQFHRACIRRWYEGGRRECPLCRVPDAFPVR